MDWTTSSATQLGSLCSNMMNEKMLKRSKSLEGLDAYWPLMNNWMREIPDTKKYIVIIIMSTWYVR